MIKTKKEWAKVYSQFYTILFLLILLCLRFVEDSQSTYGGLLQPLPYGSYQCPGVIR